MNYIKQYRKQLLITTLLLLGIIVSVYLVRLPQIFKSKAAQELYNTFQLTETTSDGEIQQVSCENTQDGYTCTTDSEDINLRVDVDELERLSQE